MPRAQSAHHRVGTDGRHQGVARHQVGPDPRRDVHAEPVDGAAPGQVACLMRGDEIVGHGVIA
jgi:tRNA U34 2-thiouridine synthase MnmA/TrmU